MPHDPIPLATQAGCALWLVALDAPPDATASEDLLTADERERAARFAFATHRLRFVAARSALRRALGAHLGRPPGQLRFAYGADGKPELIDAPDCRFNMSHSGGFGLIAIGADARPVGVDIELLRPVPDALALAQAYFDASERAQLAALPAHAADRAFLCAWTRKEASLKALGTGFAAGAMPHTGTTMEARAVRLPGVPGAPARTASVHSFELPQCGALGAIALLSPPATVLPLPDPAPFETAS